MVEVVEVVEVVEGATAAISLFFLRVAREGFEAARPEGVAVIVNAVVAELITGEAIAIDGGG